MLLLTVSELMRLSKLELCDLAAKLTNALPDYPEDSRAYAAAQFTLWNIRRVLALRKDVTP